MSKVLIVLGHPNIEKSFGNKGIIENFKTLCPEVEVDDLYKLYPDFKIDVKKEQEKLLKADCIIFHFPMFWYNAPALLRLWFEKVLEHGFAYGSKGTSLKGKKLIVSFTTGTPTNEYKEGGSQNFTLDDLMKGLHQLANLCYMNWNGFITTGGVMFFGKEDPDKVAKMKDRLKQHANELFDKVKAK